MSEARNTAARGDFVDVAGAPHRHDVAGCGHRPLAADRRHRDDAAGQGRRGQLPSDPLGAQHHVAQIGLIQCVPTVLAGFQQRRVEHPAGVVDQNRRDAGLGRPRASAASTWSPSRTSATIPSAPIDSAAPAQVCGSRSQMATDAPNAAIPAATPRPMPAPPAVTTATRPVSRIFDGSMATAVRSRRASPVPGRSHRRLPGRRFRIRSVPARSAIPDCAAPAAARAGCGTYRGRRRISSARC